MLKISAPRGRRGKRNVRGMAEPVCHSSPWEEIREKCKNGAAGMVVCEGVVDVALRHASISNVNDEASTHIEVSNFISAL